MFPEDGQKQVWKEPWFHRLFGACNLACSVSFFQMYHITVMNNLMNAVGNWCTESAGMPNVEVAIGLLVTSYPFGMFLGTLIALKAANHYGRRDALVYVCIGQLIGAVMIIMAYLMSYFYLLPAARLVLGVCAGCGMSVAWLLVLETPPRAYRAKFTMLFALWLGTGALSSVWLSLPSILGGKFWPLAMLIGCLPAILFIPASTWMYESPRHLYAMQSSHVSEHLEASITFYQGEQALTATLRDLAEEVECQRGQPEMSYWRLWHSMQLRRPLQLAMFVAACFRFDGQTVWMTYSTFLFEQAGYSESASCLATTLMIALRFSTMFVMPFVNDRFGRRPLTLVGGCLCFCALLLFIIFLFCMPNTHLRATLCVIVVSISLICSALVGATLQHMFIEIFPAHARAKAHTLIEATIWLSFTLSLSIFPLIYDLSSSPVPALIVYLFIFGICCAYMVAKLPETKKRDFNNIYLTYFCDEDERMLLFNDNRSVSSVMYPL